MVSKREYAPEAVLPPGADDLKQINGIGPAVERHLNRANIFTFADLAALSPETLAPLVGDLAGLSADRIAKQDWVGQARALVPPELPEAPPETAPRQRYATFTIELLLGADDAIRRTRIAHIQTGDEETWAGWEGERLLGFFAHRVAMPIPAQAATLEADNSEPMLPEPVFSSPIVTTPVFPQPTPEPLAARRFPAARLAQLEVIELNTNQPSNILRQGQPCVARFLLDIDSSVEQLDSALMYTASIYVRSLGGGPRTALGEAHGNLSNPGAIVVELDPLALPSGIYRTEAVVVLRQADNQNTSAVQTALLEGSLLQVY